MMHALLLRRIRRIRRRLVVVWIYVAAASLVLLTSFVARAAPYGFQDEGWEGLTELIRVISTAVDRDNVRPVTALAWDRLEACDALLVIYPRTPLEQHEMLQFLRAGGRIGVLDDFGASDKNLQHFQIKRIPAPSKPARALRDNPALAIAEPITEMSASVVLGAHPVVSNIASVVTNHPTALNHPQLTPTLRIAAIDEPDAVIAVAGQVGDGRIFVVSDASVVINQMMRYPGNRQLAVGLAQYLVTRDASEQRRGVLYVVAGSFDQSGTFGNDRTMAASLRRGLGNAARRLGEVRELGISSEVSVALGIAAAMIAMLWVAVSAMRTPKRYHPRYVQNTPIVAQGGVAGRAALLGASTTHRVLALLELKSSLEDVVSEAYSLTLPVSVQQVVTAVREAGIVSEQQLKQLTTLMRDISVAETSLVARRPIRVSNKRVAKAAVLIRDIICRINPDYGVRHYGEASAFGQSSELSQGSQSSRNAAPTSNEKKDKNRGEIVSKSSISNNEIDEGPHDEYAQDQSAGAKRERSKAGS